jgi:nucleotide-binding universal stress UspA family protein
MEGRPHVPYQSILCATGVTDDAEDVVKAAAAVAHAYKARLRLVQVIETPPATIDVDFSPWRKDMMDAADARLHEMKDRLAIDATYTVLEGNPAMAVREEAARLNADLIIAGRGLAQANFTRIWSRLYPIIRQSPCPVLSV